jgi:hypothetical protein
MTDAAVGHHAHEAAHRVAQSAGDHLLGHDAADRGLHDLDPMLGDGTGDAPVRDDALDARAIRRDDESAHSLGAKPADCIPYGGLWLDGADAAPLARQDPIDIHRTTLLPGARLTAAAHAATDFHGEKLAPDLPSRKAV